MKTMFASSQCRLQLKHVSLNSVHDQVELAQYTVGWTPPNYPVPAIRQIAHAETNGKILMVWCYTGELLVV